MLWFMAVTLPLAILFLTWSWKKKQWLIRQFVQSRLLSALTQGVSARRQKSRMFLLVLGLACLMFALARPQWGYSMEEATSTGLDIIVAIDTSRSMLAEDLKPNRMTRAKLAALDLLQFARTDRLGLVPFAGTAFLQCPLTLDATAFEQSVRTVEVGTIQQGGTALAEAIETARRALQSESTGHKAIVLMTDGENHEKGVMRAVEAAASDGIRIFTVGLGSEDGALLTETNDQGERTYVKDPYGNVVKSRLDKELLLEIATKANGFYLPLQSPDTMEKLYQQGLEPLPKSEVASKVLQRAHERFQWPLFAAIFLLTLEFFIPDKSPGRKTSEMTSSVRVDSKTAAAVLIVFLLPFLPAAQAGPSSAFKLYRQGDFQAALKEYEKLVRDDPANPKLRFNTGAAAYRTGDYERAAQNFGAATTAPDLPLQQQAYYNLGNALFKEGEQRREPQEKMDQWKQSISHYQSALKLDPNDSDARNNLEFVEKKLEQLQKQQQNQQQQQQPKDKENSQKPSEKSSRQDQKQNEQKQSNQQQKDDSLENSQEKNQQEEQPPSPKDQSQESPESQGNEGQQGGQNQQTEPPDGQQQSKPSQEELSNQNQSNPGSFSPMAGKMTREQALQLLESQLGAERPLIFQPPDEKSSGKKPIFNEW